MPSKRKAPLESAFSVPSYDLYGEGLSRQKFRYAHVEPLAVRNEPNAWKIAAHRHPFLHQVSVVISGGCTFILDGQQYISQGPSVTFIRAGVVHAFEYQPNSKGYQITCSLDFMNEIREISDISFIQDCILNQQGSPISGADFRSRISNVCETLMLYSTVPESSYLEEMKLQMAYFWLLLKRATPLEPQAVSYQTGSERDLFDRFKRLLRRSFRDAQDGNAENLNVRTVEYFSVLLNTSPYFLNKCCQNAVGYSAKKIVKDSVLAEAVRVLLYSTHSIKELSVILGYSSPSHFIRFFSQEQGVTPNQFRNAHRQTNNL